MKFNFNSYYRQLNHHLDFLIIWFRKTYVKTLFEDNCSVLASAISFYLILSFFPFLLFSISVLGYVLHSSDKAGFYLLNLMTKTLPTSTLDAFKILAEVVRRKEFFGIIGVGGLLLLASRIFTVMEKSMNKIWRVEKGRFWWHSKTLSLILVPISVLILFFSLGLTAFYSTAKVFVIPYINFSISKAPILTHILALLVTTLTGFVFFFVIYKFLPYRKIPTKYAIVGALFAAIFWEIAKYLFDFYILNFAHYRKFYGSFGTVLIMFLWVYYSAFILLLGAEIGSNLEDMVINKKP
jgi:membrane protein